MPASSPRPTVVSSWLPSQRMWWAIALAFIVGLLLFAVIWARGRGEPDFYRPGEAPPTSAAADYTPLPVPVGDGTFDSGDINPGESSAMREEAASLETDGARIVETAPPPPPPIPLPQEPIYSNSPVMAPVPIAGRTPSPNYPSRAARRRESGTVLVQATIGLNGAPEAVIVISGSGSRDLDRAAVDAVRRWRFQPATQDGRPTIGVVNVPISFRPDR